jgi:hypothetical protein
MFQSVMLSDLELEFHLQNFEILLINVELDPSANHIHSGNNQRQATSNQQPCNRGLRSHSSNTHCTLKLFTIIFDDQYHLTYLCSDIHFLRLIKLDEEE